MTKKLSLLRFCSIGMICGFLNIVNAHAGDITPRIQQAGKKAMTCSQSKDHACTVDNYRIVLDANILNSELTSQVKNIQIQSLILLLSENGMDMSAQTYVDYCDYGVDLVQETGQEKWQSGAMIYIQCMIGHHELKNYKRKSELIRLAKSSMNESSKWSSYDKALSRSDVQVTLDWANQAINALN